MEEREKAASGDIGAARAARGVRPGWPARRRPSSHEGLIALGRAEQDGHLVEGHAAFGGRGDGGRAISTHSRASPEVEKIATEAVVLRAAGRGRPRRDSAGASPARRRARRAGREAQIEASARRAHDGAEEVALQSASAARDPG